MLSRSYRMAVVLGLTALLSACSGSTGTSPPPGPNEPADVAGDTTAPVTDSSGGLHSEFLALVFPLDAADFEIAFETYEAPRITRRELGTAACLEEQGFRTLADLLHEAPPPSGGTWNSWLFPDLTQLRTRGGVSAQESAERFESEWPAAALFNNIGQRGSSEDRIAGVNRLSTELEVYTQVGVPPSDAEALYDAMERCQQETLASEPDDLPAALDIQFDWMHTLREIDESSEVASLMDSVVGCLRAIDTRFSQVESVGEWMALKDGTTAQLLEDPDVTLVELFEQLATWNEAYADCVEPIVIARQPLRTAARSEAVDARLAQLLELQKMLDVERSDP